jgi:hypothetical protein
MKDDRVFVVTVSWEWEGEMIITATVDEAAARKAWRSTCEGDGVWLRTFDAGGGEVGTGELRFP